MANDARLAVAIDGNGAAFPSLGEVAAWLEACAVRQWVPGRCVAPPPPSQLTSGALGARVLAVRHVCHFQAGAPREPAGAAVVGTLEPMATVVASLVASARYALAVHAPTLQVELGSRPSPVGDDDAATAARTAPLLDRACRVLHEVVRAVPEVTLALVTPATPAGFGRPEELAAIFEDLGPRRRLAYWHDTGRAHALAATVPTAAWLSQHGARCLGVDACDATGTIVGLPAGAGDLDFGELRDAVAANVPFVVRVEARAGPGALVAAVGHLRGLGF